MLCPPFLLIRKENGLPIGNPKASIHQVYELVLKPLEMQDDLCPLAVLRAIRKSEFFDDSQEVPFEEVIGGEFSKSPYQGFFWI